MKAILYDHFGPPHVLQQKDVPSPTPLSDEVLIQIHATTVTSADCMMRRGNTVLARIILGFFKPRKRYRILGTEFAGIIKQVGTSVTLFQPGDKVYGFRGFGTGCYASYKCMPEKGSLALKPNNLSFEEAAASVDGATTALFFLQEKAQLQRGQKVLINGASGSIGTFAVQLCKHLGAEVTGVCSTANLELVKALGADTVIDYTKEDFTQCQQTFDLVFDTVSKSSFAKCKKILAPKGKYIATVFSMSHIWDCIRTNLIGGQKALFGMSLDKRENLKALKKLIETGIVRPIVDRLYPMEQIAEAHRYVETGRKKGNVVITIDHS